MKNSLEKSLVKNKNVVVLIIYILLMVVYVLSFNKDYQSFLNGAVDSAGGGSALIFFYNLYVGQDSAIFIFFVLLSFSAIYAFNAFGAYTSKSDRVEIVRIGYRNYYEKLVKKSIQATWYYPLMINGVCLLLLFFLGYHWRSDSNVMIYGFNQEADFVMFLILQTLGWIVFSVFLTFVSQLISNKYVFGIFAFVYSLIVLFGSILVALPISNLSLPIVGNFTSFLVFVTSPFTLLTAGQYVLLSGYTNLWLIVILSIVLYVTLSMVLYHFILTRRLKQHYVFI